MKITIKNIQKMSKKRLAKRLELGIKFLTERPEMHDIHKMVDQNGRRCSTGACFPEYNPYEEEFSPESNNALWEFAKRVSSPLPDPDAGYNKEVNPGYLPVFNDNNPLPEVIKYMKKLVKKLKRA